MLGGAAVLVLLAAIAVGVGAPIVLRGPRFGRLVERMLPPVRGQIHIGGGRWTWSEVVDWVRDRSAAFELEDVRIVDPEGTEVLRAARLSGRLSNPRYAPGALVVQGLRIENAAWRFAPMTRGGDAGFLAALGSPRAAAVRQQAPRAKGKVRLNRFAVADARLDSVDATFDLPDWGLVLAKVQGDASLSVFERADGATGFTFEVRAADARGGGRLRILQGASAFVLPFAGARLDRVATTADAPDTIRLDASKVATGTSVLGLGGTLTGVYGVSRPRVEPGIDLHADVANAADAIAAVASSRGLGWPAALQEPGARVALGFAGPFAHLRIDGHAFLPSHDDGSFDGDLTLNERGIAGQLSFTRFAVTPLLPAPLVAVAGGTLQGVAAGRFDWRTGSASVDRLSITLTRPPEGPRPRVIHLVLGPPDAPGRPSPQRPGWTLNVSRARIAAGTLHLPRITAELWGGRLSVSGQISLSQRDASGGLAPPMLDLSLAAQRVSSTKLFGANFVQGDVSLDARARGSLNDLTVDVSLRPDRFLWVLGERFELPGKVALHLRDQDLSISTAVLRGPSNSALSLTGRMNVQGRMAFDVGVRDFPFQRLPGLSATALPWAGRLSGRLALTGDVGQPQMAGQLSFDSVTFQGRRIGGGLMTISPGPRAGSLHAKGRLVEGIDADGTLTSGPGGLAGDATLVLRQLRLDPFLGGLPGGVTATGLLSGTITAKLTPGQVPRAEGRLSQLALTVAPPPQFGRTNRLVRPIDLRSEGEIRLSAESGAGLIQIGPARFAGNLGSFEIEGESRGDAVRGALRGRVLLDAFGPLTAAWVDNLTGAIDVDLRVGQRDRLAPLVVNGEIAIAAPLTGRPRAVPFETHIPSGRIRFLGDSMAIRAMPVSFDSGAAPGGGHRTRGDARISALVHQDGASPRPTVHVDIDLARLEVEALGAGRAPLTFSGGRLAIDDRTLTVRGLPIRMDDQINLTVGAAGGPPGVVVLDSLHDWAGARMDLPVRGDLRALEAGGVRVDRASVDLRLQGQPRRSLLLAGDVDVQQAHVSGNALALTRAGGGKGKTTSSALPPELLRMRLDLHVRSGSGAVDVDVRHVPDLRVGVDYHIGGTLGSPEASGRVRGSGPYSGFMLWLGRFFGGSH